MNGFAAAFTAPMTITGSAKIYSIYASQAVFNGIVTIKISTDGKFLIAGQLNFAADNISLSAKLYADLSKVANGEVAILFLADVPDQARVLTLYGRLKTGFRNPTTGNEVLFVAPLDAPPIPTPSLAGPRAGDLVGRTQINSRGYLDVRYTAGAGQRIDSASIADLGDEFTISPVGGGRIVLDRSQAPVLVDPANNVWRYWTITTGNVMSVSIDDVENSWVVTNLSTGSNIGNGGGQALASADAAVVLGWLNSSYVDVLLSPTAGHDVVAGSVAGSDVTVTGGPGVQAGSAPTRLTGTNIYRFYLTGDFAAGDASVTLAAGAWSDTGGRAAPAAAPSR